MDIRNKLFSGHRAFIIFLIFSALYVFTTTSLSDSNTISADAVYDAQIAKNILRGDGLGWQATLQPPMQGILTAPISLFTEDILSAGIIVSKLMWWLLPLAVYLLANILFSSQTALIAAMFAFFHPHFAFSSNMMEPVIIYPTFLLFASYFAWLAFSKEKYLFALLGGLFFAFAYLSRSEGFIIMGLFVMLFFASLLTEFRKTKRFPRRVFILFLLLLSFAMASLPYLMFLKDTYGKPVISPKSTYVQIWMKWRVYKDNELGEVTNPELWGLSKNGKLMWQEPNGAGDLIRYLLSHPGKSLDVYLKNMSMQIPGRIPNNSGQWLYPQVYPWYFLIPAVYWMLFSLRQREKRLETLYAIAPFTMLFILPIFTQGWWKYMVPYSPFLIIIAAAGMSKFIKQKERLYFLLPLITIIIIIYSLWSVKASESYQHGDKNVQWKNAFYKEQKNITKWAKNKFKGQPNYMIRWSKLAYYLDGKWTAMPVANMYNTLRYAEKNKVDYLVYETQSKEQKNQLLSYMSQFEKLNISQIYKSRTSGYSVLFFKLQR